MSARTIAIGDIHGCSAALAAVLAAVDPRPRDTIVTLGDYVDRGPDSRGALEQLIELQKRCELVPLLGNHDEMLLELISGRMYLLDGWLTFGGDATLESYGCATPQQIPPPHIDFLRRCRLWFETEGHFFVHASYAPKKPLRRQPRDLLLWQSLNDSLPSPHRSKKVAVVGHTSQKHGEILDLGYLKCIDTCCYGEGWLTAVDVQSGRIWQADKQGRMRR